jgi:5-formyltetrahydrofolate cyclo-ligase
MGDANDSSTKSELREEFRRRWSQNGPDTVARGSQAICAHVIASTAFGSADHIVGYAARASEVDPAEVLRCAAMRGKRTYYPRIEGGDLRFHRALAEDLAPGRFGILEPCEDLPVLESSASRITFLVPGLAFDRMGGRLGSGRGYYDRALRSAWRSATRVGLVFREGVVERLPHDPWDVPMDLIVTEDGVFTTGVRAGAFAGEA